MEDILKLLSEGFEVGQKSIDENEKRFKKVEASLQSYLIRAKETLTQKHAINPKPLKRFMKTITDESGDSEVEDSVPLTKIRSKEKEEKEITAKTDKELRPVRTAKSKANQNLKELPMNVKMRNDNNVVDVKIERTSSIAKSNSRDSIKENKEPGKTINQKRKSPDEGIQSACDSPSYQQASKRSNSVEVISAKIVEIDLSDTDDNEKMPPPSLTKKTGTKTGQSKTSAVPEPETSTGLRMTRSKIKQEKVSIAAHLPSFSAGAISATSTTIAPPELMAPPAAPASKTSKANETVDSKKPKKKYPMPILVKLERLSDELPLRKDSKNSSKAPVSSPPAAGSNDTFQVAPAAGSNDTFQVAPAVNEAGPDTTVILSRNPNESLMTEDNDDEAAMDFPPPLPLKPKLQPGSALKLKKNEVFNPYLSSPVKQRVQAFEKHANNGSTPEKYHTLPSKLGSLRSGTPSKIGVYSKTTPLNMTKQKFLASATGSTVTSSAPGHKPAPKPLKKMNSLSQESLEDPKKAGQVMAQLIEERRKAREEKQRQALHARETLEKEKRENALRVQQERDEKYRKLIKEKEDKQRMEALKKNMKKEKQAKKYAEEKARSEFVAPKPVEAQPVAKSDSLHLKMQKQLLLNRSLQHQKEEAKKVYGFEMLDTDDSTDDESKPSKKRPDAPEWSKKRTRKPWIAMQSAVPPSMLDSLFSSRPICVDLREIFPTIEPRKLIRNSSAIWRTPPKQY